MVLAEEGSFSTSRGADPAQEELGHAIIIIIIIRARGGHWVAWASDAGRLCHWACDGHKYAYIYIYIYLLERERERERDREIYR